VAVLSLAPGDVSFYAVLVHGSGDLFVGGLAALEGDPGWATQVVATTQPNYCMQPTAGRLTVVISQAALARRR
jgi:hypothetical protein